MNSSGRRAFPVEETTNAVLFPVEETTNDPEEKEGGRCGYRAGRGSE